MKANAAVRCRPLARRGFTLVEMLIVSALISLFAGLAVINIQTQLLLNKQKAALAEARSIATAMSFAHNDVGFFPKLCFLGMSEIDIVGFLINAGVSTHTTDAVQYYSYPVISTDLRIQKGWSKTSGYAALNTQRFCDMDFEFASYDNTTQQPGALKNITMKWPVDPWGNPYVAYLLSTVPFTAGSPAAQRPARFIQKATEEPDFFAGIVSYGRNRVPGGSDTIRDQNVDNRRGLRLYDDVSPNHYKLRPNTDFAETNNFAGQRLDVFLPSSNTWADNEPKVQDAGSDDRVIQF